MEPLEYCCIQGDIVIVSIRCLFILCTSRSFTTFFTAAPRRTFLLTATAFLLFLLWVLSFFTFLLFWLFWLDRVFNCWGWWFNCLLWKVILLRDVDFFIVDLA